MKGTEAQRILIIPIDNRKNSIRKRHKNIFIYYFEAYLAQGVSPHRGFCGGRN